MLCDVVQRTVISTRSVCAIFFGYHVERRCPRRPRTSNDSGFRSLFSLTPSILAIRRLPLLIEPVAALPVYLHEGSRCIRVIVQSTWCHFLASVECKNYFQSLHVAAIACNVKMRRCKIYFFFIFDFNTVSRLFKQTLL